MNQILFVDDEESVLQGLTRVLRGRFAVDTALGGAAGLDAITRRGPYAVVVADMRMPGMDGAEFLQQVRERSPDTVRMMLTGNSDQETAIRAVNQGSIFRFANKPCPPEVLIPMLQAALRQHQLVTAEKQLLEDTLGGCIRVLSEILSMADGRQFARATALQELTRTVTDELGVPDAWEIRSAAMLAQIGAVAIPPVVLVRARDGKELTGAEKEMLNRIPDIGHDLLRHVPRLEGVAAIVRYQTKNHDGSGFPLDVQRGDAIPFGARLLRILNDVVAARQNGDRGDTIVAALRQRAGSSYDPDLVERVAGILLRDVAEADSCGPDTEALALRDLAVGRVLAASVVTSQDTVLVVPGTRITQALRERLLNFAATVGVREPILVRAIGAPVPVRG